MVEVSVAAMGPRRALGARLYDDSKNAAAIVARVLCYAPLGPVLVLSPDVGQAVTSLDAVGCKDKTVSLKRVGPTTTFEGGVFSYAAPSKLRRRVAFRVVDANAPDAAHLAAACRAAAGWTAAERRARLPGLNGRLGSMTISARRGRGRCGLALVTSPYTL